MSGYCHLFSGTAFIKESRHTLFNYITNLTHLTEALPSNPQVPSHGFLLSLSAGHNFKFVGTVQLINKLCE